MVVWVVSWCKFGDGYFSQIFLWQSSVSFFGDFLMVSHCLPIPKHEAHDKPAFADGSRRSARLSEEKGWKPWRFGSNLNPWRKKNRAGLAVGKSCPMDLLDVLQIPTERWRGHSILADVMKTSWNRPDGIDRMFVSTPKFNRSIWCWFQECVVVRIIEFCFDCFDIIIYALTLVRVHFLDAGICSA